jgi:hypothetical protein
VADVKSIIQLFPHSSQYVTGKSSHSLSDAPLHIIDIRTLRDFLSIRTQNMDLASVGFVKYIFENVYFFLNNPVHLQYPNTENHKIGLGFYIPVQTPHNYSGSKISLGPLNGSSVGCLITVMHCTTDATDATDATDENKEAGLLCLIYSTSILALLCMVM